VQVTACNAASLCKTALSDEILIDYTPPQLGGFMPPLQYEVQNGGQNQLLVRQNHFLYWYVRVKFTINSNGCANDWTFVILEFP
jgi:hypothetical protein